MSRRFAYRFSNGAEIDITTADNLAAVATAAGSFQGYAVVGVSGSALEGEPIIGLTGSGGIEQSDPAVGRYDNAIFPNKAGAGGSIGGIDQDGVAFTTQPAIYNIYDDFPLSGKLSSTAGGVTYTINGAPTSATLTGFTSGFDGQDVSVDGSEGVETIAGSGGRNYIDVADAAGAGTVRVDLSAGTVTKGGRLDATLTNIQGVTLGADPAEVIGLVAGTDVVYGAGGTLYFSSQGADDFILGSSTYSTVLGLTGNLVFTSTGGQDTIFESLAANAVIGGAPVSSLDIVYGGGGSDYVYGRGGTVILHGATDGAEALFGGTGYNEMIGATQDDPAGRSATDLFYGGAGTDVFHGGNGANIFDEGSGTEEFDGSTGTDFVQGGTGKSFVYGGSGADFVYTGAGDQYFKAGTGKTVFTETADHLTAGRFDFIDNFQGADAAAGTSGTTFVLPTAAQAGTQFTPVSGGTAILIPVTAGPGTAELFVANTTVATVMGQTHFA